MRNAPASVLLLVALAVPLSAPAQASGSFADLGRRVGVNDRIQVTDRSGATTDGRLATLTGDAISIDTGHGESRFSGANVLSVAKRKTWGRQGALIGALGLTAYVMIDCHRPGQTCEDWQMAPIFGAAVGAIAGKLTHTMSTVYRAEAPRTAEIAVHSPGGVSAIP
jgi:hypothetical protein